VSQFFPGSSQPISPIGPPPDALAGRRGKTFTIGGKEIELFTISQLAFYLNRKPVTIRKWESEGVIPKATYSKPGINKDPRGRRRLYSRAQVEALVRIAAEEKILDDLHKQISTTQFKPKVLQAFKQIASQQ
jgi:hypothetical protein